MKGSQTVSNTIVFEENVRVHKQEAPFYDSIHFEIFNKTEQSRIQKQIETIRKILFERELFGFPILDFGCGTGNVTGKLLENGFTVTAVDSSEEMIKMLRRKFRRAIENGSLTTLVLSQNNAVPKGKFGAIILFSVYHHLFDTLYYVNEFAKILANRGLLLIEHELSDQYWHLRNQRLYRLYSSTSLVVNKLDLKLHGMSFPRINYRMSDIHAYKEDRIQWAEEIKSFRDLGFKIEDVKFYLLRRTRLPNPLYYFLNPIKSDNVSILASWDG
ncbi:MAG: class I SAM-dependent methyltransferase [Thaumarchaeota archaeon]|nr:class I SAM-dependent methyltransferase [Nitrososphaerota archaeon]